MMLHEKFKKLLCRRFMDNYMFCLLHGILFVLRLHIMYRIKYKYIIHCILNDNIHYTVHSIHSQTYTWKTFTYCYAVKDMTYGVESGIVLQLLSGSFFPSQNYANIRDCIWQKWMRKYETVKK